MNPIVGVGELLWDVYPDGRKVAGGAPFNFAFHCQQLGHPAVIVSRVGDDDLGRELRDEVRRLGLSDEYVQTDPDHPTGTVRVTVDATGQPAYEIVDDVAWDYIEWDESLAKLARLAFVMCFGSLAQRNATSATIRTFLEATQRTPSHCLTVYDINIRGQFYSRDAVEWGLWVAKWRKVNLDELAILTGLLNWRWESDRGVMEKLFIGDQRPERCAILTSGQTGCSLLTPDQLLQEPAAPANVIDTVGAGDSFTAAMVCLHLEGRPLRECARFASHYAARVCEHQGATPRIDRAEVERAVQEASG